MRQDLGAGPYIYIYIYIYIYTRIFGRAPLILSIVDLPITYKLSHCFFSTRNGLEQKQFECFKLHLRLFERKPPRGSTVETSQIFKHSMLDICRFDSTQNFNCWASEPSVFPDIVYYYLLSMLGHCQFPTLHVGKLHVRMFSKLQLLDHPTAVVVRYYLLLLSVETC